MFIDDDVEHRSLVNGQEEPLVSAPEPFDAFYRREVRRLVGLAYALSGSRLAADDIAQEAMLAAYNNWDEVGRLENPTGWVRRVVSNQAVSAVRRRVSEAKGLSRLAMRQPIAEVPELPVESEWIWREIRRLPRRQIQVIALRYYDQLSMPFPTLRTRHRVRGGLMAFAAGLALALIIGVPAYLAQAPAPGGGATVGATPTTTTTQIPEGTTTSVHATTTTTVTTEVNPSFACGEALPWHVELPEDFTGPHEGLGPHSSRPADEGQVIVHWLGRDGSVEIRWPANSEYLAVPIHRSRPRNLPDGRSQPTERVCLQ